MQLSAAMLRTLKGSPLSILMALALVRQPVKAEWLQTVTGYSDKSISAGLAVLKEFGLATRNGRYAWQIADGIEQLPLMAIDPEKETDLPEGPAETVVQPEENDPATRGKDAHGAADTAPRKENPRSAAQKFRLGEIPCPLVVSRSINLEPRKEVKPLPESRSSDTEIFRVLDEYGIREPKRSQLAGLPHISARLIRYHCTHAANTGLAIYRISKNWSIPDDWEPLEYPEAVMVDEDDVIDLPDGFECEWLAAMTCLAEEMPRSQFDTWCAGSAMQPVSIRNGELSIKTMNGYAAGWLENHVKRRLEELLALKIQFFV